MGENTLYALLWARLVHGVCRHHAGAQPAGPRRTTHAATAAGGASANAGPRAGTGAGTATVGAGTRGAAAAASGTD